MPLSTHSYPCILCNPWSKNSKSFLFGGVDDDDSLRFVMVKTEGNESLNVPKESLEETMGKLSAYVRFPEVEVGDWQRVDTAFAVRAFENGDAG